MHKDSLGQNAKLQINNMCFSRQATSAALLDRKMDSVALKRMSMASSAQKATGRACAALIKLSSWWDPFQS